MTPVMSFLRLTLRGGKTIHLNVAAITAVQPIEGEGAAVHTVDGKSWLVEDDADEILESVTIR